MTLLAVALILAGLFFLTVSTVGVLRLPDFYCRSHAAGKSETLGALLVLSGLALHQGVDLNSFKMLLIVFIVSVTGPTAVHALSRAALRSGNEIWTRARNAEAPREGE